MKVKIAHLSDPHFGTIKPDVLEALHGTMKELEPEIIVVSGDITQRAKISQFKEAHRFFKSLGPIPIMIIPGNHDIALFNIFSRLFFTYWAFRNVLDGTLGREFAMNEVEIYALNSTSRFRIVQGRLRLSTIEKSLSNSTSKNVVKIVAFHHPMACPKRVDTKNLLENRCEVIKILEKHKVDLVLNGHIHDPYVSLSHENYKHIQRTCIISVAGTCLSWRTRADAPNSFHWIDVDTAATYGPSLQISRYDLQKDGKFRSISKEEFIRQKDSGWQRANFPTKEIFDPGEAINNPGPL